MERIYIEPTTVGDRGPHYRVTHNSETLIESTSNPEYDACRALLAKGITGKVETWRHSLPYPCMRLNIEQAAKRTIEENSDRFPVRKFRSRDLVS